MTITEGGVIRLAVLDCQDDEVVDLPIYGVFRMTCVVGFADLWGVQDGMRLWVLLIFRVFRMI